VEPVGETSAVYLLCEEVRGCDLDEDEEGVVVAVADFGGQTNSRKGSNEFDKASFSFSAFYEGVSLVDCQEEIRSRIT
jgi:hypothetical protein